MVTTTRRRSITSKKMPINRSDTMVAATTWTIPIAAAKSTTFNRDLHPLTRVTAAPLITRSSFSRESSPSMDDDEYLGSMPEASASMSSLVSSSSSSSSSMSPMPTTQLLLCPVCNRAFKPSKNQNCNLRRHLKNVHNMSPAIHPRKCKWDSLPDGRVKDDKDRKERTRKSKRLWARKFRLRRKVEEAAVVLSMLSQAI
ncbi:hypothetical protein BGX31_005284 [Mortierella sp. GBA43]|nr:hypothetical protein BGX31_005284 [Mortierella sp. GBA43]